MLKIQNEELFKRTLRDGINLFLGAGFSVLSANREKEALPLVTDLIQKICEHFELTKYKKNKNLGWLSKQVKRKREDEFRGFLKNLYSVSSFNSLYKGLYNLNIMNILTTNIDNLVEKIFDESQEMLINDTKLNGILDSKEINLYKLHGSITYSYKEDLLFSTEELSGAFLRDESFWKAAQIKHHSFPSLFWGINISDSNIIDLIDKKKFGTRPSSNNWILILEDEEFDVEAETFQEDGFFIIRGNTKDLLRYFNEFNVKEIDESISFAPKVTKFFEGNSISFILSQKHPARPVTLFYEGDEPRWSDIIEEKLYKLSFYNNIQNELYLNNHIHITGIHGSGKTTLLMQLAASDKVEGNKFYFNYITDDQAQKFINEYKNTENVILFLDNLSSSLSAFNILKDQKFKIISAERDIVSISIRDFDKTINSKIIDIGDLNDGEIRQICRFMNKPPQSFRYEMTSLFEIVLRLWSNKETTTRIKEIINVLNDDLLEFYTLNAYARYTGIACSMDMLISYYTDDEIHYNTIYQYVDDLRSAIDENNYYNSREQDYFTLRSKIFSEMSLKHIPSSTLGKVIGKFHQNIHRSLIHNFKIFRRKAWDADIIKLAFPNKNEGIKFYEEQRNKYDDPFISHQFSLYLYRKHDIDYAWRIIEEAFNDTKGRIYSINNTHAMFLFERNIDKDEDEHGTVENMLEKSFDELELCLEADSSKSFHTITYANHSIRYHERFKSEKSIRLLESSLDYLNQDLNDKRYKPKKVFHWMINLKRNINEILR